MTTASVNIKDPRAWIYAQFAAANVASAILVSSNPTNLVLSGAFDISYVTYTANMIVPVAFTVIVLFPFLLYFVFRSEELVPHSIHMHALPGEVPTPGTAAAGPEIPGVTANGTIDLHALAEQGNAHHPHPPHTSEPLSITLTRARTGLSTHSSAHPPHGHGHGPRRRRTIQNDADEMNLAELLDPHLDRPAAIFCVVLFVITLAVLLATNAAGAKVQVYAITVPAAAVMLARDMVDDWILGRREGDDESDVEAAVVNEKKGMAAAKDPYRRDTYQSTGPMTHEPESIDDEKEGAEGSSNARARTNATAATVTTVAGNGTTMTEGGETLGPMSMASLPHEGQTQNSMVPLLPPGSTPTPKHTTTPPAPTKPSSSPTSLESLLMRLLAAISATFPRASKVISQLPFPLLPFTFGMFILVQGLVTKGWVEIFANGWEQWVRRTGTLGAIGGMGCISVLLCNFAGTNIGATIVLSRVLQQWLSNHNPSERTRDASIYALALGVNYGAFSLTFSASLAGLLWRDILGRKGIHVRAVDFARYNNPLIWCSMVVGCAVLVGQVYIVKAG
ncbi:hypothetical protein DL93DRAFT_2081614 [Clavulina sp. PMI_390]|nr:hypothetical protein DL93DRAFT_2081614 [Clavulina sp. PMI_390]